MAEISVKFNTQTYHLACQDGEEDRLARLAEFVDGKAAFIKDRMGVVTDTRLLLMTAILIADELDDAQDGDVSAKGPENDSMDQALHKAINRIEDMARTLEMAG